MGRIDAWDELSLFGIWDESSLYVICSITVKNVDICFRRGRSPENSEKRDAVRFRRPIGGGQEEIHRQPREQLHCCHAARTLRPQFGAAQKHARLGHERHSVPIQKPVSTQRAVHKGKLHSPQAVLYSSSLK